MRAWMRLGDVDRPPLGDVAATMATMVVTNPEIEFRVEATDGDVRESLRGPEVAQRLAALVAFQEALP